MKKILIYLFSLFFVVSYSQEEASNWYFGDFAGIKFNPDGSVTSLTEGRLITPEGCATISDEDGNLLFYTDGITVWNKLHDPMPNANPANGGGLFGNPSSTQSGIIVPKPNDPNIYYIFTVDTFNRLSDEDRGFNYSVLDLTLNGGLGDIVIGSKNINLLEDSSEKLSAVLKDCETQSIWVITFSSINRLPDENLNTFYAYEVSETGINTTPVSSTFPNLFVDDFRGYLKFSPDGSKIALANSTDGLYLFDFDTATGTVSNQTLVNIAFNSRTVKPQSPYGVEFSPNNEVLYVSTYYNPTRDESNLANEQYGALLQYDLTAVDISSTELVLDDRQTYRGALQLAPNGKIYRALTITYDIGTPYLGVINNPNEIGTNADYQHNAVLLNSNSRQGLPPFITSFFSEKIDIVRNQISSSYLPLCIGETYTLISENIPGATYTWTRDDILLPETDFDLEINTPGTYNVLIETNSGDCDTLEGEALVEYFTDPLSNQPDNIIICDRDNDGNYNFDFSIQDSAILGIQDPDIYTVSYHLSQNDADLNQNEIISPYNNGDINPQEIFIRLGINGNTTCYDTSKSFMTYVYNTPVANRVSELIICDTQITTDLDPTNGQTHIDLHQFDAELLYDQNDTEYSISYYSSISDAQAKNAPLNFNYYNQTAFNETIYARIENVLYDGCFDISEPIHITVNPLPEYTNTTLIQCDADGIEDDITTFNLLEAENTLINSNENRSIKFFNSLIDAQTNNDEIDNTEEFINSSNPQILFVEITNTETGCFDIAELTLEISTNQINNYNVPPVCDELDSEDGINTFNLNDITTQIQLENTINLPISYYATYEDALLEENELISPYENTAPYSQIIFARAENNNACYGISEVLLTINELPELEEDTTAFYCINTYPETITLSAGVLDNLTNDYTYNWSNGSTNYETEINEIGTYTVEVTNNINQCSKVRTIIIEPSDIAHFETPPYHIRDASRNNMITVFTSGDGIYQYALYNDEEERFYRDFQDSNVFENVSPGIYTINVKDVKNDCGITYIDVSIIGFPKYFTPNNDGINDTWQIIGVSSMFYPNTKIAIYNRFGKLLKEITPLGEGWNGLLNGVKLPADDYWFSVKLQDGRVFKNHFTLKY